MNIEETLKERGSRYGEFETHALVTQNIKCALLSGPSHYKLQPYMLESLEMIAHKMGRIVNGDPFYQDSWVDIAGYAQLVVDQLKKEETENRELESLFSSAPKESSDGYPVYGYEDWNNVFAQQSANEPRIALDTNSPY